jgi:predicted acylesterase/phospholipase RssA
MPADVTPPGGLDNCAGRPSPAAVKTVPQRAERAKLGLALAGGGFRASLFHLGVLWRMAELDLLRYVEVLSTVSGGSIIGALYVLLLRRRLATNPKLDQKEYVEIVNDLHRRLAAGIQKDLRTRLLMNPFGILRLLLTQDTLGKRMGRLYERYLYAGVVDPPEKPSGWRAWWRPGWIRLRDVRFAPGGRRVSGGLERYNREAVEQKGCAIPNLILNATALNSGAPFRFSSVEVGDPRLGFFRHDEIDELMKRKTLLDGVTEEELRRALAAPRVAAVELQGTSYSRKTVALALWWRTRATPEAPSPETWEGLFAQTGWEDLFDPTRFARLLDRLAEADFGPLRQAKLPAWYLTEGARRQPTVDGGLTPEQHRARFWEALRAIDDELAAQLQAAAKQAAPGGTGAPDLCQRLMDLVVELYDLRTAQVMSPRIRTDWDRLTLGEAVGASACFPPVFPPYMVLGFYDDLWVSRLGLTDGGVYDNLGITTLLDERCTYIVASDTGGLFDVKQRVSAGRLGMSGRIVSILMDDVAELQRATLRVGRRIQRAIEGEEEPRPRLAELAAWYGLQGLAFFHINSPTLDGPGLRSGPDPETVARIRTDLDAFGDVEIAALVNRGYETADQYLRKHLDVTPYKDPERWRPPATLPLPLQAPSARVQRILEVGGGRFFRSLKLWSPVSWTFTLLIVGGTVWKTWGIRVSLADVIAWLASWLTASAGGAAPWLGAGWTSYPVRVGAALLAAIGAAVIATAVWPQLVNHLRNRYPRAIRRVACAAKWARSYALNALWLLGGAPLWIAFGGAAFAWISHLFYHRPFLHTTRNRP